MKKVATQASVKVTSKVDVGCFLPLFGHRDDSKLVWRFGTLSRPRGCQMKALSIRVR